MAVDLVTKRAELERWIAGSEQMQRRIKRALPIGIGIAIALCFWRGAVGGGLLATVLMFGGVGMWITAAHIADWRSKIARLGKPPAVVGRRARD